MTKSIHRAPVDVRSLLGGRASHETHEKNLSIGVFLASEPGARCRLERQDALIGMVINHIFLEMDLSVCADHFPPANRQHRRRSSMAASAAPICTIWRSKVAQRIHLGLAIGSPIEPASCKRRRSLKARPTARS